MTRAALASTAVAIIFSLAWVLSFDAALAGDRELRAILDQLACTPQHVVPTRLSPTLVVYEVTCKQSGRVVHVECLAADCRLLARAPDDREGQ